MNSLSRLPNLKNGEPSCYVMVKTDPSTVFEGLVSEQKFYDKKYRLLRFKEIPDLEHDMRILNALWAAENEWIAPDIINVYTLASHVDQFSKNFPLFHVKHIHNPIPAIAEITCEIPNNISLKDSQDLLKKESENPDKRILDFTTEDFGLVCGKRAWHILIRNYSKKHNLTFL